MKFVWMVLGLSVGISACHQSPLVSQNAPALEKQFMAALEDASYVEPGENTDKLFPINAANSQLERDQQGRVKVVTWKKLADYTAYIKPNQQTAPAIEHALWVTAVPQLQSFCQNWLAKQTVSADALTLRLKQYLGLREDWRYDVFVEMWVDPRDMFRPCVDNEIDDGQCELSFGSKPVRQISNIPDYRHFFEDLYYRSYRQGARMPWTGLGYTYDWGSPHHIGASEYILRPQTPYQIERVVSTQEYCAIPNGAR